MDCPKFTISNQMEESIGIQRVNSAGKYSENTKLEEIVHFIVKP